MNKIQFIFYISFILLCVIFSGFSNVDIESQIIFSSILILLIGIPHGAIDHLIILNDSKYRPGYFYFSYIALIAINTVLWFIIPVISLCIFFIFSSYHFGQSQFNYIKGDRSISRILYLSWGLTIIMGITFFNFESINFLVLNSDDLSEYVPLVQKNFIKSTLLLTGGISISLLLYLLLRGSLTIEKFVIELFILGIIQISFFLLPLIVGFTLYFVILHSLKVLVEEFEYLRIIQKRINFHSFIKMLIPFTSMSIFFVSILLVAKLNGLIFISYPFLLLVLISAITLPHSIVMEKFYSFSDKKGINLHNTING